MTRIEGEWRYLDDTLGIPFPWYTKPCLEWLTRLDLNGKRVFEYGTGDSTAWYQAKGALVYGVESNLEWAQKSGAKYAVYNTDYISAIQGLGEFDIVVVDGLWRDECAKEAIKHIKPGGYLIADNFEQPSVEPNIWNYTIEAMRHRECQIYHEPSHKDWKTLVIKL